MGTGQNGGQRYNEGTKTEVLFFSFAFARANNGEKQRLSRQYLHYIFERKRLNDEQNEFDEQVRRRRDVRDVLGRHLCWAVNDVGLKIDTKIL